MGKRRYPPYHPAVAAPPTTISIPSTITEQPEVKVTLNNLYASPLGVGRPGTVIDVPETVASELKSRNHARDYDKDKDANKPQGLEKAPTSF